MENSDIVTNWKLVRFFDFFKTRSVAELKIVTSGKDFLPVKPDPPADQNLPQRKNASTKHHK